MKPIEIINQIPEDFEACGVNVRKFLTDNLDYPDGDVINLNEVLWANVNYVKEGNARIIDELLRMNDKFLIPIQRFTPISNNPK